MIYTITFNPALDYVVRVDTLRPGQVNRTSCERILPGGKGINVSIVLANLGHASRALGFVAGFTGAEIERLMAGHGVSCDFIHVQGGMSRINVKVSSDEETEINGLGPALGSKEVDRLLSKLDSLRKGDVLVIAGSIPAGLPIDMYERIMGRLARRGVDIVVDAERDLLVRTLAYHPFLVKPNQHELEDLLDVTLAGRDDAVRHARRLQELGARNVLVSLAGDGAVLVSEDGSVIQSVAPHGTVVSSVGAGDSMVAGFIAGWIEAGTYEQAFRMGLCAGSASAFSADLATRQEVETLLSIP